MSHPDRPAWIEVSPSSISSNIASVRKFVGPNTGVLSVIKANAYGHGLIQVAHAALKGGATALGVALLQEGLTLRANQIQCPIIVLSPALPDQASELVAAQLSPTVTDHQIVDAIATAAQKQKTRAQLHVKIDTGMGRVGISPSESMQLARDIAQNPHLDLAGISTHIAWETEEDMPKARAQIQTFKHCLSKLTDLSIPYCHAANSVMTTHLRESHLDLVRVGLLTYGIPPAQGPGALSLMPALSLKARITQVRDLPQGQTLSYGGTCTLIRPSRIALLPLGYADGYNRGLSNRAHVLVRGQPCPVVGAVCMDLVLIDVTDIPNVCPGEEVVLLGKMGESTITVADLAHWAGIIPHEVVSQLHLRLPRYYLPGT